MGAVVVLHAWWGLNDDVRAFADELRRHGHAVETPDLYGGQVATEIPDAERLMRAKDMDAARAGIDAAVDRLGTSSKVAAVGFSMGGGFAFDLVDRRPERVSALITYYGADDVAQLSAVPPTLTHFAEHDDNPAGFEEEHAAQLAARGVDHAVHTYPGTRHWFAEPSRPEFDPQASALAFERTLEWIARTSKER